MAKIDVERHLKIVEKIPLLRNLSMSQTQKVLQAGNLETHPIGHILFREGSRSTGNRNGGIGSHHRRFLSGRPLECSGRRLCIRQVVPITANAIQLHLNASSRRAFVLFQRPDGCAKQISNIRSSVPGWISDIWSGLPGERHCCR